MKQKQYLKSENIQPTIGKKIILAIGIGITVLIPTLALSGWHFNQNNFDFTDTNAEQLNTKSTNWKSIEWTSEINIVVDQGSAILYWHDKASVDWNCSDKQNLNPIPNKTLKIRHDQCLIFLPKKVVKITAHQADIVIIRPQARTNISLRQSKLRIAEKGVKYTFEINAKHSAIGDFTSYDNASTTINIQSEESQIEKYQY